MLQRTGPGRQQHEARNPVSSTRTQEKEKSQAALFGKASGGNTSAESTVSRRQPAERSRGDTAEDRAQPTAGDKVNQKVKHLRFLDSKLRRDGVVERGANLKSKVPGERGGKGSTTDLEEVKVQAERSGLGVRGSRLSTKVGPGRFLTWRLAACTGGAEAEVEHCVVALSGGRGPERLRGLAPDLCTDDGTLLQGGVGAKDPL